MGISLSTCSCFQFFILPVRFLAIDLTRHAVQFLCLHPQPKSTWADIDLAPPRPLGSRTVGGAAHNTKVLVEKTMAPACGPGLDMVAAWPGLSHNFLLTIDFFLSQVDRALQLSASSPAAPFAAALAARALQRAEANLPTSFIISSPGVSTPLGANGWQPSNQIVKGGWRACLDYR